MLLNSTAFEMYKITEIVCTPLEDTLPLVVRLIRNEANEANDAEF
jgi:hypothetical protein